MSLAMKTPRTRAVERGLRTFLTHNAEKVSMVTGNVAGYGS